MQNPGKSVLGMFTFPIEMKKHSPLQLGINLLGSIPGYGEIKLTNTENV